MHAVGDFVLPRCGAREVALEGAETSFAQAELSPRSGVSIAAEAFVALAETVGVEVAGHVLRRRAVAVDAEAAGASPRNARRW